MDVKDIGFNKELRRPLLDELKERGQINGDRTGDHIAISDGNLIVKDGSDVKATIGKLGNNEYGIKTTNDLPIGTVTLYAGEPGSTIPQGWLICDGTTYDQSTYPELYAVIGQDYGGTVGTFALPNITYLISDGNSFMYIVKAKNNY